MSSAERVCRGYDVAASALIAAANEDGHWTGELSSSPLSTATAIAALELVQRQQPERAAEFQSLIEAGLHWLIQHQNPDGGWGDTVLSHSNISTTALVYASFRMIGQSVLPRRATDSELYDHSLDAGVNQTSGGIPSHVSSSFRTPLEESLKEELQQRMITAKAFIDLQGGFDAIRKRYGKDRTFSVPILTQCALAGLIPWDELPRLPFELGCLPHWFFQWIRLPVVSYALPALIAIGQVRDHYGPSRNPILRLIRRLAIAPTRRRLERIQPTSGGFLEATPLTSFVTMSLAAMGQSKHAVALQGVEFLKASARPDGSWPIDTNLATWVTTLSVNALNSESVPSSMSKPIADWLLRQQYRVVHPYTNAAPGGWAWTNLTGGVPDADDTPGAILALLKLDSSSAEIGDAVAAAIVWLVDLQNRDGGWPTFCRGWGALPFDRSAPDLTAHVLRAFRAWLDHRDRSDLDARLVRRVERASVSGFQFLTRTQRSQGTWIPLWFGNQYVNDDENPVYGTARVLAAYRDWGRFSDPAAQRGLKWLAEVQNSDGGWGGAAMTPSTTEETALVAEVLLSNRVQRTVADRGIDWLLAKVEANDLQSPSPIGLYFAKLWYFERLYPIIFAVAALARAANTTAPSPQVDFPIKTGTP